MTKEINLINDVISSGAKTGFDEDAVYDAWSKILNHLAVEGYYDEEVSDENNTWHYIKSMLPSTT